jgi:hypothetical protein
MNLKERGFMDVCDGFIWLVAGEPSRSVGDG